MSRARPPYQVLALRCPHCAAPLGVPDERAQLVVCGACDQHLELSGAERDTLTALGTSSSGNVHFELPLGQVFKWEGVDYKVTARLLWIEEGDLRYSTRVYVLYHPRRSLLFLDEYDDVWTLMAKTHVSLRGKSAVDINAGDTVETYDGRSWECEEVVVRELVYVDGCLPWMVKQGDNVVAQELRGAGPARFEIEGSKGEVEHNEGRVLLRSEMSAAMPDRALTVSKPPISTRRLKSMGAACLAIGIMGAGLNGCLAAIASSAGAPVHEESFSARQLTEESTSGSFALSGDGLVKLEFIASGLDNAWMALDAALVADEDAVIHVTDAEMSYYHGVDGGESWSEGSSRTSKLVRGVDPGRYRLLVKGVSSFGDEEQAATAQHDLRVRVIDRARSGVPHFIAALVSGLLAVVSFLGLVLIFKMEEEDD